MLSAGSVFAASSTAQKGLDADKVCTSCHNETWKYPVLQIYQTPHGVRADADAPLCQTCHGQSSGHLSNPATPPDVVFGDRRTTKGIRERHMIFKPSPASVQNKQCLSCHEGGMLTHWSGSKHQINGLACASCHSVHMTKDPMMVKTEQPEVCFNCHKQQQADFHKLSHHPVPEGKLACSDCHDPMGSAGPHLLKKNTVNEVCWQCHADKRGPFLWEHQPVTESCLNCHTPHGSNIETLLKERPPFLCEDCHNGPHQSSGGQGPYVAGNAAARACLNCHVMVHGSNSPAGAFLHH